MVLLGHGSVAAFDCAKADEFVQTAISIALTVNDRINKFFIVVSLFLGV
jgi:uncharacterized protein